ncbi:ABC transporter ATP-binding protein [uncultured Robinsoniella sp.]|uniref:ABC transporter ATP-binding protein n=1 Tax=uncultured Robinsoniella sp. TaxID=904190 RepID=UPI00374F9684
MKEIMLELKDISKSFSLSKKQQHLAVNQVNLQIMQGEVLGLVGESGCGKSTLARVIMGVYAPTQGEVLYKDEPLQLKRQSQRKTFAKQAQMIFQDPYMSLDPHMTVESIIGENLEIHGMNSRNMRRKRVEELLELTGLSKEYASRFPHEFSGGQRQRIGIARALAMNPEFVICDEPISALDISIRSQIINLLISLKETLNLTYLFISHDLNIVRYISDRIAVMYAGRIVEIGEAKAIYEDPQHPYTKMLLDSVLVSLPDNERLEHVTPIMGDTAGSATQIEGCPFAKRCPRVQDLCEKKNPILSEIKQEHFVSCHRIKVIEE